MRLVDLKTLFAGSITPYDLSFKASEFVFVQGAAVEGIFGVEEGKIRLERYTLDGNTTGIHHAKAKESFAEASLFSDFYDCHAVALKPSRLVLFPKEKVLDTLRCKPDLAIAYIRLLSFHVKSLRSNLELRGIRSARGRILSYFLQIADIKTGIVMLPCTLKDLSHMLGIAHETIYREIR
ncbi:MAG: Crp/Fnr family transcriptional regulator, partial [Acidobacteriota bacterium]|nr:Crp/Fnr family transcriptional regulator [Acidobacteriota bacterium]